MSVNELTSGAPTPPRSTALGWLGFGLSALLLGPFALWAAFAMGVSVTGCLMKCTGQEPTDVPNSLLWGGVLALLLVDIVLWTLAGRRRFAVAWTIAAAVPAVLLGSLYLVGAIAGSW